jgi:hypothetical protein
MTATIHPFRTAEEREILAIVRKLHAGDPSRARVLLTMLGILLADERTTGETGDAVKAFVTLLRD